MSSDSDLSEWEEGGEGVISKKKMRGQCDE